MNSTIGKYGDQLCQPFMTGTHRPGALAGIDGIAASGRPSFLANDMVVVCY